MLENSKKINPGVSHFVGDMRSVRLDRKFDLVLVHDAVSYMKTEDDLNRLFETARHHLEPGGSLIMSPDRFKDFYVDNELTSTQNEKDGIVLSFAELCYDLDPTDTMYNCHFSISVRSGSQVGHFQETHELGVFWMADWRRLLEGSGFACEFDDYVMITDREPGFLVVGTLK
jgi:hypothetical protein